MIVTKFNVVDTNYSSTPRITFRLSMSRYSFFILKTNQYARTCIVEAPMINLYHILGALKDKKVNAFSGSDDARAQTPASSTAVPSCWQGGKKSWTPSYGDKDCCCCCYPTPS